jgi:trigger factor
MELTEVRSEGLSRTFSVVVPKADLEAKLAAKIAEVLPRLRINGFRPGKVPASHVRKVYGAAMMQDIINEAFQESTQGALAQANVRPASEPRLDLKSKIDEVQAGESDLAFEVNLDVMPDFEPADVSKVALDRPVADVDESHIQEALEGLARASITFVVKEDGPAAKGDQVKIDFVGKLDGAPFEGGSAEGAELTLGSGQFIPGFEEALEGVKAGDETAFDVTFPEAYPVAALAGRAATFDVKVLDVRAPQPAEIDDALAKRLGLEDLAALKEAVRDRIRLDFAAQSRSKAKRALFDKLDALHAFELPPGMVEAVPQHNGPQNDAHRMGARADPDDEGKSDDELRTDYRAIAERRVRLGLLLAEIGRKNNIQVPEQEVARAIAQHARNYPGQEQRVFDLYAKNQNLQAQIRAPLYEEKVVDFLLELAKVTNVTVTREALFAEDEGTEPAAAAKA